MNFRFITLFLLLFRAIAAEEPSHYYSTAADEKHYSLLRNLIASIHKVDFNYLEEIAVFDLGMTADQEQELGRMQKVAVYKIQMTHPDLLTYFTTNPWNKKVRGWYAWKPVVLKQALERFPYLLYLDAGTLVLSSPNDLFKHIQQNGYFLLSVNHNIVDRMTNPVREKLIPTLTLEQQRHVLDPDTWMVAGGIQGLSQAVFDSYILPIYSLTSDISFFADDGSARLGFGEARHDQNIFSIYARALNLKVNEGGGWSELNVDGKSIPFHYHWKRDCVNDKTCLFTCRFDGKLSEGIQDFIRWKNE